MVAEAEVVIQQSVPSATLQFVPSIRSGSFADIGSRRYVEDEHIRIDDLSAHLGSFFVFHKPSAFYGVFDGHGGPEAAAYFRKNVLRFFSEDAKFPQTSKVDDAFLFEVENSLRKAFLLADLALADDCSVSSSSGTTALAALILGRYLMVASLGDCRAVLCRKGIAIEMSQDHRPNYASEQMRVEELGGYIDDGYLNGVLSVTRAMGDWDMKFPRGSSSPLLAEPEFCQVVLTKDDEFLIIGCDGIQATMRLAWCAVGCDDMMTQNNAQWTLDPSPVRHRKLRCCLSGEAMSNLRSFLDDNGWH
ncbi:putative protein phosphatase 2C 49 [Camellia lanceoleosa]|uniref:Uncharacterized protein n=1 Tax=Camellia lanceoleosa TaxID=1840588 RepID=A0ACC0F3M5_9ERIC|nr:putative protein phosphatase 2C 49 [Camellia lanceoleosa]